MRGERRPRSRLEEMATAHQFIALRFWERFSCFAHFLYFDGKIVALATTAFLALSFAKKGERCAKRAVHSLGHYRVHPTDSVNRSRTRMFGAAHCRFWAWRGRVMGWNDPAFSSLARPKGFSGSFQPTLAVER